MFAVVAGGAFFCCRCGGALFVAVVAGAPLLFCLCGPAFFLLSLRGRVFFLSPRVFVAVVALTGTFLLFVAVVAVAGAFVFRCRRGPLPVFFLFILLSLRSPSSCFLLSLRFPARFLLLSLRGGDFLGSSVRPVGGGG